MDSAVGLNAKLNRASRMINLAAVAVSEAHIASVNTLLPSIVDLLARLSVIQASIIAEYPELEFHFDPSRAATAFMRQVQLLETQSEQALSSGDRRLAIAKLDEALNLEPPAIAYEILERRRDELLRDA